MSRLELGTAGMLHAPSFEPVPLELALGGGEVLVSHMLRLKNKNTWTLYFLFPVIPIVTPTLAVIWRKSQRERFGQ